MKSLESIAHLQRLCSVHGRLVSHGTPVNKGCLSLPLCADWRAPCVLCLVPSRRVPGAVLELCFTVFAEHLALLREALSMAKPSMGGVCMHVCARLGPSPSLSLAGLF